MNSSILEEYVAKLYVEKPNKISVNNKWQKPFRELSSLYTTDNNANIKAAFFVIDI